MKREPSGPIVFHAVGVVRSPHTDPAGTPIQPAAARDIPGSVLVFPQYHEALKDLDGFSHIYLLSHFHRAGAPRLTVTPFLDDTPRGLFATRAPARPNPIGLSVVRLDRIEEGVLYIRDVDLLDGTPVLDIKPYVPGFDLRPDARGGWTQARLDRLEAARDDGRFAAQDPD